MDTKSQQAFISKLNAVWPLGWAARNTDPSLPNDEEAEALANGIRVTCKRTWMGSGTYTYTGSVLQFGFCGYENLRDLFKDMFQEVERKRTAQVVEILNPSNGTLLFLLLAKILPAYWVVDTDVLAAERNANVNGKPVRWTITEAQFASSTDIRTVELRANDVVVAAADYRVSWLIAHPTPESAKSIMEKVLRDFPAFGVSIP